MAGVTAFPARFSIRHDRLANSVNAAVWYAAVA